MPGLNWAVGLDALRVLEWADEERLDWLLSVEADELDDIMERIKCGVHGSRFARRDDSSSQFGVQLLPECEALVLPEACRGAAVTGALPSESEPLWRVTPSTRAARGLERCAAVAPYWVSTNNAADAVALGRSLPRGASWVAHLQRRGSTGSGAGAGAACASPLSRAEVEALRAAGCAGVAVADPTCLAEAVLDDCGRVQS